MKKVRLWCAALCALLLTGCAGAAPEEHTATLLAMDTVMQVTAYGENGQAAVERSEELIQELDGLLSVTDTGSEIYRANHGQAVELSGYTAELLSEAVEACISTKGALDVTIYPVVRAWGFTTGAYKVPDAGTISALLEKVDYTRVQVRDAVLELPEGVEIDLGAAAKGYAGDRVMEILRGHGVVSGKAALGGNVQVLGAKPDGSPWRVAVRDPEGGEGYAAMVEVTDRAVVTSGGYERYFEQDGRRYCHIIDPATGYPADSGLASVTIVCESGVWADCLSTALFVMGREKAADYWRSQGGGFEFILIGEDGTVTITEGLEGSFTLSAGWAGHTLEVIRR